MKNDILYEWKFQDKQERGHLWYIIASSIVIGLCIWWFMTGQYGMSFIILLIAGIFYFVENNSEDEVPVQIQHLWVKIGTAFYDYSIVEGFSVIYDNENALFIRFFLKKKWLRSIDIRVDNKIVTETKEILSGFLEEKPKGQFSVTERIISKLKL